MMICKHNKFLCQVETFGDDQKYLSQLTGLDLNQVRLHNNPGGTTSPALTQAYLHTLTPSERHQVFRAYYVDFVMFGYL